MGDREEGVPEDAHISGDSVDSVDCGPLTQWEKQPRKEGEKLSFSHVLLEQLISRSGEMFSSHWDVGIWRKVRFWAWPWGCFQHILVMKAWVGVIFLLQF